MEKGEMRVEANISVSDDPNKFGTKVEVKNLNSFKAVEKSIAYEINRHINLLESGQKVVQETRGFDENKETTFSQRKKEDSHDYRYFPDPDLPKLYISEISEFTVDILKKEIPELPEQKRIRYKKVFELKDSDVEFFVNNPIWSKFFEDVISNKENNFIITASNYIVSDLVGLVKNSGKENTINSSDFRKLIEMINKNLLSSRGAKDILKIMFEKGGDPETIANENNLIQKNNEEDLIKTIKDVISNNQKVVEEYKAGKQASLQFLIGQAMKITKGSANPQMLKSLFEKLLA
jgi:aspartyl-tRNA(Asn)/glutamyl-tRNA(Gln) amidotransferase subunit B